MSINSRRRPVADRFWSKVTGGDVTTCWQWTGPANPRTGYGNFRISKGKQALPHRFAYELLRSEIPAGLQIDHLCRTPLCVNPWHMEPVTAQVNVHRSNNRAGVNARRTECANGHPFTEANTYTAPGTSGRACRTCRRERNRVYQAAGNVAARAAQDGGSR